MRGTIPDSDHAVDVAIVTWNTRDLTLEAIATLIEVAPAGTRVLVRDNGSTDGTAEAIGSKFPDVKLDAGSENLGFAGGVNSILARSGAPWVLLLNSDAWPEPGAVETLVEFAASRPAVAAVAPRLLRPDGELEHSAWVFPSLRVGIGAALSPKRYVTAPDQPAAVDWVVGAALLIRRSALEQIGGLDDSLFMYAEDLDWCWRARDAKWQVWLCPTAVVRHVGNASGSQKYGKAQPAAWVASTLVVYRRRHSALGTAAWRVVNAAGAARQYRKARRSHDHERMSYWRLLCRSWLGSAPRAPR